MSGKEEPMKKRVLSLLMAVTLCFSTVPMTAFAQEADTSTEQETTGTEAASETVPEITSEPQSEVTSNEADTPGEDITDISGGDAAVQDAEKTAAVKAVQKLIDALPEEVTVENAETIGEQLAAIDVALENLAALDETLADALDMTRYDVICEALTAFAAAQDNHVHDDSADHGIEGASNWTGVSSLEEIDTVGAGCYYLTADVELSDTWYLQTENVVLCLNGHSITMKADKTVVISYYGFSLCDCTGEGIITHGEDSDGNKYKGNGVAIYYGTFYMTGGKITGNTNGYGSCGGGVALYDGRNTHFVMTGGEISDNKAQYGGGVWMNSGSTFTLKSGIITDNTATNGGGVYVMNETSYSSGNSVFTMDGGTISSNQTSGHGGGVCVEENSFFTMNSGTICDNVAKTMYGGGVYVGKNGTFALTGGSISENKIKDNNNYNNYGGGVFAQEGSNFSMTGGSINGNTAKYGGGVCTETIFTMSAGKITGNTALRDGGGVYDFNTFIMSGTAEIAGNSAEQDGGGVYVYKEDSVNFKISDEAKITGNYHNGRWQDQDGMYVQGIGTVNNIYLPTGKTIEIAGKLTGVKNIGITLKTLPTEESKVVFANADTGVTLTEDDAAVFFADESKKYAVTYNNDNTLSLGVKPHAHYLCGSEENCNGVGHSCEGLTTFEKWTSTTSLPDTAGNYYLTGDVELTQSWYPADNVILCLNGYSITGNMNDYAIATIGVSDNFTLCDCNGSGENNGIITLGNDYRCYGVATRGSKLPVFNMYGGSITGNCGGMLVARGTFNMYGGSITGNNNTTESGGGVCVEWASDGLKSTFNMYGGTITDNETGYNGGGVYVGDTNATRQFTFNMYGGTISGNTASGSGDGVYVNTNGVMTVGGAVKITGNGADGTGSNIYLTDGKTITVDKALNEDARIGVTTGTALSTGQYTVIAEGTDNYTLTEKDRNVFVSDDGYNLNLRKNNVILVNGELHEHPICGEKCTHLKEDGTPEHGNVVWTAISTADELNAIPAGTEDAPNYCYLTQNIELTTVWTPHNWVVLDLNGNDMIMKADDCQVIWWRGGTSTFTLTDCKGEGKITHATGYYGNGVYMDNGNFIMYGGNITGNITGKTTKLNGGGVAIHGGTFRMLGGQITGNKAQEISGKGGNGGGVYITSAKFIMEGGTITGNTADNTVDNNGGGVYADSYSTMTVSGDVKIENNWIDGTLNSTGIYENGTTSNVYLRENKIITIGGAGLSTGENGARIGITTYTKPTDDAPVQIVTGVPEGVDYTRIFKPDETGQNYMITQTGNDLYLSLHQHSWNYKLSEDKTTITATCEADGCPGADGGSVTIKAPDKLIYDGTEKAATLENGLNTGVEEPNISYRMGLNGTLLTGSLPKNAGEYTASITVGGVTAEVTYEIVKAAPKAEDFVFTSLGNLTYDGKVKNVKVGAASGINGMGDVTVKYYQGDTVVQEPTNAGDYTVKIDVAEGTNYKAVNDLTDTDWQFTIAANTDDPNVELSGSMSYTGKQITPEVTVTVDGTILVKDRDYTIAYGTNVNAGENVGTVTITAKGNYAFKEVTKNFTIEQAERTLSFTDPKVNKTYGDAAFSNALVVFPNIVDTVTYASDNNAVATVDESTGKVTIVGAGEATITVKVAATTNYKEGTASYTLTVEQAAIRISSAFVSRKTYDGNTTADVTSVSLVDKDNEPMTGLRYGIDYKAVGEFQNADAGEQNVSVKVTLLGDLAKNYTLENDTFATTAEISAMPVRLGSATAEKRVYKRNDTSVKITGLIFKDNADDLVNLTEGTDYTVTGEMEDANAGENKNVTVTVNLLSGNYSFINNDNTTTAKVTILKDIPFIEAAASQTLVKNGVAVDISGWAAFDNTDEGAKLTYALEGNPIGITLTGNQLTAANAADTEKEFTIKVSAASTTNFVAPADKTITVTVVEKEDAEVQITAAPAGKTYGDADFTLTATKTAPDGGTWSWTSSDPQVLKISDNGNTATPTIKVENAGTAILTVSYSSDDYYGSANVKITVEAKAVTAVMIDDIPAREYTGEKIEPTPAVKDGAKALTEGKDFTFSYSGNVKAGTATLTVTGRGNYKGTANKDFTISPKSINGATIVLDTESLKYNGEEQTVNIKSVTLGGKELSVADYTIENDSNKATDANDSITLTIKGQGNYTGTATTTWEITKIDPELADFKVTPVFTAGKLTLTYDGKARSVVVEKATDSISGMGNITVKYNDSTEAPVNAGSYKVTIDVSEGSNYNAVTGMEIGTLIIEKAQAPVLEDIKESYKYTATGRKSVSVADLVADATGYTLGEAAGDIGMIKDLSIDKSGVVSYTLTGTGKIGDTMTLPVSITFVNYETATVNVVITLTEKDAQEKLVITGDTTVVYGQTLTLGTTGGSGTGKVTYHISTELGDGAATIEGNILTPVKVGAISITATKAADADYLAAVSAPVVIIITQAASTGEPKYTVITTDGKTLADAGLTLTDSTIFPAEGTLEWIDSEGEALSEDTVVEVNKTYKWCFTPEDDNYAVLTGEVELYHVDAPVISSQPESASVKTGEKATFEVSATGTDLTYQWMIDRNDGNGFVAISGADSASYTTGVTDLDCNGFKYYCVISNAAGAVTTDIVTLTVSEDIVPTPEPTPTPVPTPTPTPDRDPYEIIDGANSSWTQDTDGTIVIRGNGEFAKFQSVKVDGNVIDASNYTAAEGSTIITLRTEYLKTLSEGSHSFEIVWTDGSASTNFVVVADTSDDDDDDSNNGSSNNDIASNNNTVPGQITSPKTGDASGIWTTLFVVSIAGFAAMLVRRKKENNE